MSLVQQIDDDIATTKEIVTTRQLPFFRFSGQAAHRVTCDCFWVAVEEGNVAILLAGSPTHVLLGNKKAGDTLAPSADPLGAVKQLFGETALPPNDTAQSVSVAWHELFRDAGAGILPTVEGVAVFAGVFPAARAHMRRIRREHIHSIVVGSPIFVRKTAKEHA